MLKIILSISILHKQNKTIGVAHLLNDPLLSQNFVVYGHTPNYTVIMSFSFAAYISSIFFMYASCIF